MKINHSLADHIWKALSVFYLKKTLGKDRLCVTIIADFCGVLLVAVLLLVTWVIWTPNPLDTAKSP